ncbi:MAG: heavy metal translocating P-type ATPase metal-binding domain-containing protein [Deltaproteobacteria bacterium]|nr:heavy metal translocating P-type ATPase metal-binding domain-containing protein [Deltaproteobacteria bacterium]
MAAACIHCRSPIEDVSAPQGYCCVGCATVAALLKTQGLTRYYALQNAETGPVSLPARAADLAWLESPLRAAQEHAASGLCRLDVDVQGIRCSACVWLLREVFRRQPGAVDAMVNPAVGRVTLTFRADADVAGWVRTLESLGYRAGPPQKSEGGDSDRVLTRLGICVALTMNSMMFTVAHYAGMTPADGDAFPLMRWLNLLLSAAVLWIGGREFFTRTYAALRRRVVPFDLPIAMGLTLAFLGSVVVFVRQPASFSYFDTVNTFTTLMLVGRWLQERLLERNRRQLLAHDGLDGLFARRVVGERVETVRAHAVRSGDLVLLPPGGLLVVDGTLQDAAGALLSLDWINGESAPRAFAAGDRLPAGSFNATDRALRVVATCDFGDSSLGALLSRGDTPDAAPEDDPLLLRRLTALYVPFVLLSAAATFLAWAWRDLDTALAATTAVLVVTCPCALGLAIPLGYQRVNAALRVAGLFVRRGGFLDRAVDVRRVVFDKTGTLTLGQLALTDPDALRALPADVVRAVYNLAARSTHPRSRAIHAAVPPEHQVFDSTLVVTEHPGCGLSTRLPGGEELRLGSASFAGLPLDADAAHDVWVARGGTVLARLGVREQLRFDARAVLSQLRAAGYGVSILSGDAPDRVARAARELGLPEADAVGGLSPSGKADWLRAHGGNTDALLIGDGVNDQPGFGAALCSGTPAVEHPTLSARADFYFLTSGIGVVHHALDTARALRRTVRRIRAVALTYNLLSVAACLAGWVTPLVAAVAMPASSVLILLYTMRATRLVRRSGPVSPDVRAVAPVHAAEGTA